VANFSLTSKGTETASAVDSFPLLSLVPSLVLFSIESHLIFFVPHSCPLFCRGSLALGEGPSLNLLS